MNFIDLHFSLVECKPQNEWENIWEHIKQNLTEYHFNSIRVKKIPRQKHASIKGNDLKQVPPGTYLHLSQIFTLEKKYSFFILFLSFSIESYLPNPFFWLAVANLINDCKMK